MRKTPSSPTTGVRQAVRKALRRVIRLSWGSVLSQLKVFEWVLPKIGLPQNGWFIMENPIKMDDLGGEPTIYGNIQMGFYQGVYEGVVFTSQVVQDFFHPRYLDINKHHRPFHPRDKDGCTSYSIPVGI